MYELKIPFDGKEILTKRRKIRRELLTSETNRIPVKIAILGGTTTDLLQEILEIFLLNEGIEPEFYIGEYGRYFEEVVFENQKLRGFSPDYILFHTGTVNIQTWPQLDMCESEVQGLVQAHMERLYMMWEKAATYGSRIIQNNYEMPFIRLRGNMDGVSTSGWTRYIWLLNEKIYEYAQSHSDFIIHDICYLSAQCGMDQWFSTSQWYQAHLCPGTGAISDYCYSIARLIASRCTGGKKVIVTDLDQTLWPGIVAETGTQGLELSPETAQGEAHLDYQKYLLELRKAGVILCVASKNDKSDAVAGLSDQKSLIKPDMLAVIKANWNPKDQSIREIAEALNVFTDSVVFIDDSMSERTLVRENVPGTAVPEFTSIDQLLITLSRGQYFVQDTVTREDLLRADLYQKQQALQELKLKYASYEEYLRSLEMHLQVKKAESAGRKRVLQLIEKTHRFHMSDIQLTEESLLEMLNQDSWRIWCAELNDNQIFHGMISCMCCQIQGDTFWLKQWVMSCRVFERGVEHALMNTLVSQCKSCGAKRIQADYNQTEKNHAMEELLKFYGFHEKHTRGTDQKDGVHKQFVLNIEQYVEIPHVIKVEELL